VVVHASVDRRTRHRADIGVEGVVEGYEQRREDAAVIGAVVGILVVQDEITVVVGVVGVHDTVAVGVGAGAVRVVTDGGGSPEGARSWSVAPRPEVPGNLSANFSAAPSVWLTPRPETEVPTIT